MPALRLSTDDGGARGARPPITPAITMLAHEQHLATAYAKYSSEIPMPHARAEIDALVREISYLRAELLLTRSVAERVSAVLETFGITGKKLERVGDQHWAIETEQGWTRGKDPWDALQRATRIESVATQLSQFASRLIASQG